MTARFPRLPRMWADHGYSGIPLRTWVRQQAAVEWDVVSPWWRQMARDVPQELHAAGWHFLSCHDAGSLSAPVPGEAAHAVEAKTTNACRSPVPRWSIWPACVCSVIALLAPRRRGDLFAHPVGIMRSLLPAIS